MAEAHIQGGRPRSASEVARYRWAEVAHLHKRGELQLTQAISPQVSVDGVGRLELSSLADLPPTPNSRRRSSTIERAFTHIDPAEPTIPADEAQPAEKQLLPVAFWSTAGLSIALGASSVVPYTLLLARDPGCPLFVRCRSCWRLARNAALK